MQINLCNLCVQTLASVMENLPQTNIAELLISLVCLAVLVPVKEINTRYRQRLRTPIPVEILTVSWSHVLGAQGPNSTSGAFLHHYRWPTKEKKKWYFMYSTLLFLSF